MGIFLISDSSTNGHFIQSYAHINVKGDGGGGGGYPWGFDCEVCPQGGEF